MISAPETAQSEADARKLAPGLPLLFLKLMVAKEEIDQE